MKYLIAGLGNIGKEYELTRHNIGFMVLDKLAQQQGTDFSVGRLAYKAELTRQGRQIHLIKPTTYMNLSGKAVNYWLQQLNIPKEKLLVITDDLALPFGRLRMKQKGSSAGHNGLKSIEAALAGQDYARLRFGIGDNYARGQQADFVLSPFAKDEWEELPERVDKCVDMVLSFVSAGIERTMSQFNE